MSPLFDNSVILTTIILAFASYRITRLIVVDTIFGEYPDDEHPRGTGLRGVLDRLVYDDNGNDLGPVRGWFGSLLTCYWCVGVWVSAALVWLAFYSTVTLAEPVLLVAAVAGAQGLLNSRMNA